MQNRSGGTYYNNLFLKNPIQLNCCQWPSDIGYNVMLEAIDMQAAPTPFEYGWGINITSYRCAAPAGGPCTQDKIDNPVVPGSSGTRVHHNIIAKSGATILNGNAIKMFPYENYFAGNYIEGAKGVAVDSNIVCDWRTGNDKPFDDQNPGNGNTFASSNKPNPAVSNHDATCASLGISAPASVADYYVSIGGPGGSTIDDFLNAAMTKWTKISWDDRYMAKAVNAYIRPTYGLTNPPDTRTVRMTVN